MAKEDSAKHDDLVKVPERDDPLLALIGSGCEVWADEHADEYVQRLREEWD